MITEKVSRYAVVQVDHPETVKAGEKVKIALTIITKDEMAIRGNVAIELQLKNQLDILRLWSTVPPTKDCPVQLILETPVINSNIDVSLTVKMDSLHGIFEEEIRSRILVLNSLSELLREKISPSTLWNYDWFGTIKRNPSILFLCIFGIFIARSIIFYYENEFSSSEIAARYGYYSLFIAIILLIIKQFRSGNRADLEAN